ncbi:MAG: MarR family transcriptional regulator [Rhodobacteraceae bacterium]|nr:MarR family transcriptional regulator [Paracoccaceae bacterium]
MGNNLSEFILEDFLPYQLSILTNRISRDFSHEYVSRFNLDNAEWRIIAHLSQVNQPISIREIYSKVDLEKSKVSRAVSRLSARAILTKTENLKDRRLVDLKLTKCGKKIIDQMTMIAKDYESEVLAKIEDPEYFRKMLNSLINDKIA